MITAGLGKTVQCIAFLAALLGKTGDPAVDATLPPAGAVRCAKLYMSSKASAPSSCLQPRRVRLAFIKLGLASPAPTITVKASIA